MKLFDLDLRAEAIFWAEVAYPYFCNKRQLYKDKGGLTKALSAGLDFLFEKSKESNRANVGLLAAKEVLKFRSSYIAKEDAKDYGRIAGEVFNRFERYANLSFTEVNDLRNFLAVMVIQMVNDGLVLDPNQNTYDKRLGRRRLDSPEDAAAYEALFQAELEAEQEEPAEAVV